MLSEIIVTGNAGNWEIVLLVECTIYNVKGLGFEPLSTTWVCHEKGSFMSSGLMLRCIYHTLPGKCKY